MAAKVLAPNPSSVQTVQHAFKHFNHQRHVTKRHGRIDLGLTEPGNIILRVTHD